MRFSLKHILRWVVGRQARPNYRVPLAQCGQCAGFVPLLRSTCVSTLGRVLCQKCRQVLSNLALAYHANGKG